MIAVRGSQTDDQSINGLITRFRLLGVHDQATAHLNRHGPKLPLIRTNGDALSGRGAFCRLIQFVTPERAVEALEQIEQSGQTQVTGHVLHGWDWRAGGDGGEVLKGTGFTVHGITPDSKISNSLCAFLPFCLYEGKDDAQHTFHFAKDCREELLRLERGVLIDIDPLTGQCCAPPFFLCIMCSRMDLSVSKAALLIPCKAG